MVEERNVDKRIGTVVPAVNGNLIVALEGPIEELNFETGEKKKLFIMKKKSLVDRLQDCYTGAVFDVLRAMGFTNQTLPDTIRPLQVEYKIAGKIFTIEGNRMQGADANEILLK